MELTGLYEQCDVLVYPSYGEGFGLIPLQALATGMPVISTTDWAPYASHIDFPISARADRSIWSVHPGDVYYPNYDELIAAYHSAANNIGILSEIAYLRSFNIAKEYDWDTLTKKAFKHLENRF
jgi:glycosyltransferase involved in cell wall biosynthesis